jgi:hypothetical protein
MERKRLIEQENGKNSFISLLKGGAKISELKERDSLDVQNISSWFTLFAELFCNIKDTLEKIKSIAHLSREKFSDTEYGEFFYKTITKDIAKTDSVLDCFADYLKINSPIPKTNTVHILLEEVLKNYENVFGEKKIKIFKKQYEENLPETSVHDEQLKFILNSVLQYAIHSIPPHGSIGFLTRFFEPQEAREEGKHPPQSDGKYIEILIAFTGYEKGSDPFETVLVTPAPHQEGMDDFILRLAEEIVKKNRGMIKFKVDDEKPITLISLTLPIERRKMVHYQSTTA